jgi:hypothetical protein
MKTKIYCVVVDETCSIVAAYSRFETAIKMARAFHGVTETKHSIRTVSFDFIDFDIISRHIEKKVLDRVR